MPIVGFLRVSSAADSTHLVRAFRQGLNEASFVDGQNVANDYGFVVVGEEVVAAGRGTGVPGPETQYISGPTAPMPQMPLIRPWTGIRFGG
jgi:hypothetical protein